LALLLGMLDSVLWRWEERMALTILIADDHEAVRQGLRQLISEHQGWVVCKETDALQQTLEAVGEWRPDIVILDLSIIEGANDAVQRIRAVSPNTELLVFTMHEGEERFRALIAAGVRGYVFKSDSTKEVEAAIAALAQHKPYFTGKISEELIEALSRSDDTNRQQRRLLSPRERQIIQLLAEGNSNKEIALALRISVKTVETHRASLMKKLGVSSVVEIVHYAIRNGIVSS
jgi:DNA-binding NarL/FixJ family response regulator